jgi:hypothetical protein
MHLELSGEDMSSSYVSEELACIGCFVYAVYYSKYFHSFMPIK